MMTTKQAIHLLHRLQDEQFDGPHGDERREALEMAVRALEQNLGDNGSICTKTRANDEETGVNDEDRTTDDLISRKQVLNASHFVACWDGVEHFSLEVVDADFIQKLPSVQPTQTNADSTQSNTLDCVSRQAAIDLLKQMRKDGDMIPWEGKDVFARIRKLPSAQPPASECWRCNCKKMDTVHGLDGTVYTQDKDKQGWTGHLPSAQSETHDKRTETHECDLINRQQAIDIVRNRVKRFTTACVLAVTEIEKLPSAQPERKKGKWINHRNDDGHNIADCDQCGNALQWFDGDEIPRYCCMCGARMDGESDGT